MNLAVVGSGYVGLVAGACFAELGHQVILVDNNPAKVQALQRGELSIHEQFLPELIERHRGQRLTFTGDLGAAVRSSQAIFIAVGTPAGEDGRADLSYVESVARGIAGAINEYKLIVEKSTVPVYTSEWIRRVLCLNGARLGMFDVASNPEFLREGTAVTDFLYPDRIVAGTDTGRAGELLARCYAPLTSGEYYRCADAIPAPDSATVPPRMIRTSASSAELIKHASNAFLAMKISFVNAVASICESVGANVDQVVEGLGSDSRIGPRFLCPGIGYGGSCFPKDLKAFRAVAQDSGYNFPLLDEVISINDKQRQRFLGKVRRALWTLKGKKLAVLGLAFKGGTDDVRDSPAVAIVQELLKEGCEIAAYDPAAMERAAEVLPSQVNLVSSAYEAACGADALLILTDWEEFATLELERISTTLRYPIVIDGRNLYTAETMTQHGLMYLSVGRPDVALRPRPAVDLKAA